MMLRNPITTEKAIRLIETQNMIAFVVDRRVNKKEIKKEIEAEFKIKAKKINTQIRKNKKIAYVTLMPQFKAIDLATKLGMI